MFGASSTAMRRPLRCTSVVYAKRSKRTPERRGTSARCGDTATGSSRESAPRPVDGRAVGIVAAVVVAVQGHMDVGSTAGLLGWTIGGAAVTAVVAAALLWVLRG